MNVVRQDIYIIVFWNCITSCNTIFSSQCCNWAGARWSGSKMTPSDTSSTAPEAASILWCQVFQRCYCRCWMMTVCQEFKMAVATMSSDPIKPRREYFKGDSSDSASMTEDEIKPSGKTWRHKMDQFWVIWKTQSLNVKVTLWRLTVCEWRFVR